MIVCFYHHYYLVRMFVVLSAWQCKCVTLSGEKVSIVSAQTDGVRHLASLRFSVEYYSA